MVALSSKAEDVCSEKSSEGDSRSDDYEQSDCVSTYHYQQQI